MFGFPKKKRPTTALDEFIFAVYGNPPPPKRADVDQAISLACDQLLLGLVDREAVRKHTLALAATPIPYSTHDLAVSVALNFFKEPQYIPDLFLAQLAARMQAIQWTKDGLVVGPLMKAFEDTLYKLYKAPPPTRPAPTPAPKPIPAPDDQRHEIIRQLILHRVGPEDIGGDIREMPLELVLSTVDSAIFIITEQYYMFRDRGLDEPRAIRALNESQATTLALVGQELPLLSYPATLFDYARHFIDSQFSHGAPISDDVIHAEIEAVKRFYGRTNQPKDIWEQLVLNVRRDRPLISTWLESIESYTVLGSQFILYYGPESRMALDSLLRPNNYGFLQKAFAAVSPLTLVLLMSS